METSKALPPIKRIAKYTLIDEVQQRSFVVMFVICAICVFLVRGCYQGNYMVNGQALDAATIIRTLSKATFHVIGAGVMVITALLSMRIPEMKDRGAYMGINSSIQQVSGGIASFVAGLIIFQPAKNAPLQHFDTVGYVAACSTLITLGMMFVINRQVSKKLQVVNV
jgi:MFS family permease